MDIDLFKATQHPLVVETDYTGQILKPNVLFFFSSLMANGLRFSQEDLKGLDEFYNDTYEYPSEEYCCDGGGDICDLKEGMQFEAVFIPFLYSVAFAVGVLGNGLLLGVLFQSRKTWSVTDTFILHLGVADVLLLVTLPLWAAQAHQAPGWTFGTPLCKITGAVFTVITAHNSMITVVVSFFFHSSLAHFFCSFRSTSTVGSSSWPASVWTATCPSSTPPRCTPAGTPGSSTSAAW